MPVVVEGMEDFAVVCISFYGKFKGAVRTSFFQGIIYFYRGSNWHRNLYRQLRDIPFSLQPLA